MKFVHVGDLHLGKSLGDFDLIRDQRYILDQIIDLAESNGADCILIAGDIYDKSIPSEAAVGLFDYFINRLAAKKIKVFAIPGNHDSDERLHFGSGLFENSHVYISARFDGKLHRYELKDEKGKINIYLMPFIKASQVRHFYPDEEISTYHQAVKTVIEHSGIDPEERNILVAHQFVAGGGRDPELAGSESPAVLHVGLVEQIGYDLFDLFDYVALGHIHAPQKVGREEIRYSGSPLKYSLKECGRDKSLPIITTGAKGQVDIKLEKLKPRRDLRHLKGKLRQLLHEKNLCDTEDYIYATLTDEDPINDAMRIFRQYYPHTVRIDYDNAHTREMGQVDITHAAAGKSFEEMISEFYEMIYGCDISEEELAMMKEAAREAGVDHETS